MLRRAQLLMNRLGLLAVMLFAMGAVWPASAAVACVEPVDPSVQAVQALAAAPLAPPCEDPACEHCIGACGHSCCHAPHVASPHAAVAPLDLLTLSHDALRWASSPGAPLQAAYGLERPPRV
ncbi:hypothetical protein [Brevundimonas sp. FT23042]|uniref:hypothetical protein n=1 Tax=Brevundimonas sp. FT23042 TaxID=3393749 RepID=UPI003B5863DE